MKKVLAALVALAMLVTLFSAVSFAEDFDLFIDFGTEEGQACGEFFGNGRGCEYQADMGDPVKAHLENHTDDGEDASADNGGLFNNGIKVKFNASANGTATLTLKLSCPDANAVQNPLGLALGYAANGGEFNVLVLGDDAMQSSFEKTIDIDVSAGENYVSFVQLNNEGNGGNGWRINIWSIGFDFTYSEEPQPGTSPASIINEADYDVSYVINKGNATSWSGGQIGDMEATYFFKVNEDGIDVAFRGIGFADGNMIQVNFNPGNFLWETSGQFVSFRLGDTLTVLQHNHKNALLDDDSAGGADITDKVAHEIVKLDNGYEFKASLPKALFTVTDVAGADAFVFGQDDLYFGLFMVAGGGGLSDQQNTDFTDWTCRGLALNQHKFAGTPAPTNEPVPQTGDGSAALISVLVAAFMGAAVIFMKKRAF